MSAKSDLVEKIKRKFGWPSVRVEVDLLTIHQHIEYARDKFIKYAVGNSTQEVFFTIMLSAGQYLYDMPDACTEVVKYMFVPTEMGGINTLFTIANAMYSAGVFDALTTVSGEGYSLVSYHIARDFLENLTKYTPDEYNFKYHSYTNQLEIQPPPLSGSSFTYGDYTYDSPGFVLIHAFFKRNGTLDEYTDEMLNADIYSKVQWVEDYATALTQETLGYVRRKFANFTAMGTQGTALDGDNMISEAKERQKELMDDLMDKETYEGGYICIG